MPEENPSPAAGRRRITSLESLSQLMLSPRMLIIPLEDGQELEITIRGLTSVEAAQVDKIVAPVAPPKWKPDPRRAGGQVEDGPDYENPAYRELIKAYSGVVRAAIIDFGVVDFKVPGNTFEEKSDWLRNNLPPRAVDLLVDKIRDLTGNAIAQASFSSASGSAASRS